MMEMGATLHEEGDYYKSSKFVDWKKWPLQRYADNKALLLFRKRRTIKSKEKERKKVQHEKPLYWWQLTGQSKRLYQPL